MYLGCGGSGLGLAVEHVAEVGADARVIAHALYGDTNRPLAGHHLKAQCRLALAHLLALHRPEKVQQSHLVARCRGCVWELCVGGSIFALGGRGKNIAIRGFTISETGNRCMGGLTMFM